MRDRICTISLSVPCVLCFSVYLCLSLDFMKYFFFPYIPTMAFFIGTIPSWLNPPPKLWTKTNLYSLKVDSHGHFAAFREVLSTTECRMIDTNSPGVAYCEDPAILHPKCPLEGRGKCFLLTFMLKECQNPFGSWTFWKVYMYSCQMCCVALNIKWREW